MNAQEKLTFFQELLTCNDKLYNWTFDTKGNLLNTNSADTDQFGKLFFNSNCKSLIDLHLKTKYTPLIISIHMGLMWGVAFQKTDDSFLIHAIGPVFSSQIAIEDIRHAIAPWEARGLGLEKRSRFLSSIKSLPVVSIEQLYRYVLMMHFCLYGEKLNFSDIISTETSFIAQETSLSPSTPDRHRHHMAEQALLTHIRKGNLHTQKVINDALALGIPTGIYLGTPFEQKLLSYLAFLRLCTHAAIDGGLSINTAWQLSDSYALKMQNSRNLTELQMHFHTMYLDFVQRVHRHKLNDNMSSEIISAMEYIELHIEDALRLEDIAAVHGYTPYYFARKFKREMHCALTDYVKAAKLEQVKLLLTTTDLSIQEISDKLHFCSRTYLADHFKAAFGCSPTKYRQKMRR